jgi:5-methyltetrahydropteroyltriglutamate--homocysteine methyltransferase
VAASSNMGMPRIGPARELKRVVEAYWDGRRTAADVLAEARTRRSANWRAQAERGITFIPSNDFSLYDHVLDTCCLLGTLPARFGDLDERVGLDTYTALARGTRHAGRPVAPLEMTKWFDTNYHYLIPELGPDTQPRLGWDKPVAEFREAEALQITTRPVLLGPVSFLLLAKPTVPGFSTLELLPTVTPVYQEVLNQLSAAGADWVQLDEPCLVTDLSATARDAFEAAYATLAGAPDIRLLVATYFGGLGENAALATGLGVDGLHVDLVRDPGQLPGLLEHVRPGTVLSAGVVDGRNVWRSDLRRTLGLLREAHEQLGDRLWIAPSCSLQHVPYDINQETGLDPVLRSRLAFAYQKLDEVAILARALSGGPDAVAETVADALAESDALRTRHQKTRSDAVRRRTASMTKRDSTRRSPYQTRAQAQRRALPLPPLPTTTIGSFPQTTEIRRARRDRASGAMTEAGYREFCRGEIARSIRLQQDVGLDVLVHGEPERNDMVQYFAERLDGFACTRHGWVQSYGTRYVRPPILHADVSRPAPITTEWLGYAQSCTSSPVKGMLTGPVTILQWSFARDDQPREDTCRQIALAVRDEVTDLEAAGIAIIQVDEPALREGLPLRRADRPRYLAWATECFRLATAAVADTTQIHTHMCYAEFADILDAIVALDADVISVEAARSAMDVLGHLTAAGYPAAVGPGVFDVHSPNVPATADLTALIRRSADALGRDRIWVNPDCGLKTRRAEEVVPALANMVAATRAVRTELHRASRASRA